MKPNKYRRVLRISKPSARLHANLREERQKRQLYQYLIDRSDLEAANRQLTETESQDDLVAEELTQSVQAGEQLAQELQDLQTSQEQLIEQRGQNDIYQRQQILHAEKKQLDLYIQQIEEQLAALIGQLNVYGLNWRQASEEGQPAVD